MSQQEQPGGIERPIKLISLDLDGTLLDDGGSLTPLVKEAIGKARDRGVKVTLATGRMFKSARVYAEELGLVEPLITYQGAVVRALGASRPLYERPLPLKAAQTVIRAARARGFTVNVYLDDCLYVAERNRDTAGYEKQSLVKTIPVGDLLAFLDRDPTKVLVVGRESDLLALAGELKPILKDSAHITRSLPQYLEFIHPRATKAHGLRVLRQHLGLAKEEVMTIGDSYNDLEIFAQSGLAVAMGNARPEVKAAAHWVTADNNHHGVAVAIMKYLDGSPY